MNKPAAAAGPAVAAGVPSDSEPWPAFARLPKTGDRIAYWCADDKRYYEGELRPCLGPAADGWMNLTTDDGEETDVEITQARHENRCWRPVVKGEEGSVGSPSPRAGQTEEVVSGATAMSEVDQIPALRFGGRSSVDRPAPGTAAQADAALAGAAQAGAAVPEAAEPELVAVAAAPGAAETARAAKSLLAKDAAARVVSRDPEDGRDISVDGEVAGPLPGGGGG